RKDDGPQGEPRTDGVPFAPQRGQRRIVQASTIAGSCVESMANSAGHVMHIGASEQRGEFGASLPVMSAGKPRRPYPRTADELVALPRLSAWCRQLSCLSSAGEKTMCGGRLLAETTHDVQC